MEKISLKNWILFSAKAHSNNYISNDKKWLLKTVNNSGSKVDFETLLKEKELSDKAKKFVDNII